MAERFVLVFLSGPRAGERVPMAGERFTVGRKPGNSLVVSDASVSGHHCEIHPTATGVRLKDLGSTNGTFCGGAKVLEAELRAGDQFLLGTVPLRLEHAEEEIELESPGGAPVTEEVLELVEDEPFERTTAPPLEAVPARASASAVAPAATAPPAASFASPSDASVVTDGSLVERARKAADAASRRGRLTTLVVGVAAVAALGVAGYLAFLSDGSGGGPRPKPIRSVDGNLLAAAVASFEVDADGGDTTLAWQLRDTSFGPTEEESSAGGPSAAGFTTTTKRSHSGERAVETRFEGRGVARATSPPVTVAPGQVLHFAAQVSAGPRAGAVLQVLFRSRTDPTLRVLRAGGFVAPGVASGKAFQRIEGSAAVPSGCNLASLSIVGVGKDDGLAIDDVEILAAGSAPPAVVRKNLEFDADALDGRIRKIDRDLVRGFGIARAEGGGARRHWLLGRGEGNVWTLLLPEGDGGTVALAAEAADSTVTYRLQCSQPAGLFVVAAVERAFASEILVKWSKEAGRFRGEFSEADVSALVFGEERDRVRLSFDPPVAVRGIPSERETRLEIAAPPALAITVQFSFEAEKLRAAELEQQAEAADREGRFGEALALRAKIVEEFPFEMALVERNQTKREARLAEGQKGVARLEKRVADAELFRIPEAFRDAKRDAQALVAAFAGTDVAERANGIVEVVDRSIAAAEAERGEREAARLKTIADAFAALQAKDLSAYIRDYLKKHFPSTQAASAEGVR